MDEAKPECLRGLHKTRAIIFDFDGTLAVLNIDFSMMTDRVFDMMKGFDVDEGSIKETYLLEIIDEVTDHLYQNNPGRAERFYDEAHRILRTIELGAAEQGRLLPGATVTLGQLRKKGLKIGIVTRNCEDAVRKVFPGINHFCAVFVSRNATRKVKPHPEHLTRVMKALDVRGEETVMVGDHTLEPQQGRPAQEDRGVRVDREERAEHAAARIPRGLERIAGELLLPLGQQPRQWWERRRLSAMTSRRRREGSSA